MNWQGKKTDRIRRPAHHGKPGWIVLVLVALLATALPAAADTATLSGSGNRHRVFLPVTNSNITTSRSHGVIVEGDGALTYVLKAGDDLTELALDLGRDADLMACVTPSASFPLSSLRPGQTITVPAASAICHTVQPEETLAQIAERYQVTEAAIVETAWNGLKSVAVPLKAGQRLLIEGGRRTASDSQRIIPQQVKTPTPATKPTPAAEEVAPAEIWPYGDGHFIWPVEGVISQGYREGHKAIDIAADFGLPVVAADNGEVTKAGWSDLGYGLRVVIDHNIDYVTLYAHLSDIVVAEGQVVEKGQVIGFIGSTGNSTGPHLHFEIRDFGQLVPPLDLLD